MSAVLFFIFGLLFTFVGVGIARDSYINECNRDVTTFVFSNLFKGLHVLCIVVGLSLVYSGYLEL